MAWRKVRWQLILPRSARRTTQCLPAAWAGPRSARAPLAAAGREPRADAATEWAPSTSPAAAAIVVILLVMVIGSPADPPSGRRDARPDSRRTVGH
ncbi:hypothetical protein ACQEU6_43890 [Spirillospora sp. CA-108201]